MSRKPDESDKPELSPAEQREQFWKRLEGINAGMLGFTADLKLVPMSHTADPEAHALWFIGSAGTHLGETADKGAADATFVVAEADGKLYAQINGRLEVSDDQARLDEMWNSVAASWFEDGRDDPDVRLLKLSVADAEVWTTSGSAGFLYQLALNKITGKTPDLGEHFSLKG